MPTPVPKVFLRSRRVMIWVSAILTAAVVAAASVILYQRSQPLVQKINYSQLYKLAETSGGIALTVEGETLTVRQHDGSLVQATVTGEAAQHEVVELYRKNSVPVEFKPLQPGLLITALNWLLPLVSLALVGLVGWRVYASVSGRGSFDLADHNGKQNVGFADVAGVDEAKGELAETIEFLREPERFGRLGGRIPRGILLCGPPETGKTLLARAA